MNKDKNPYDVGTKKYYAYEAYYECKKQRDFLYNEIKKMPVNSPHKLLPKQCLMGFDAILSIFDFMDGDGVE